MNDEANGRKASVLDKFLKGLHRSAEAIDDAVLLTLPHALRDAFVALDNIERMYNLLEIDEALSFIDEFTAKHSVRFLLILNTDKLGDKAILEKFREQAIHYEIVLKITPDEGILSTLFSTRLIGIAISKQPVAMHRRSVATLIFGIGR